MPYFAHVRVHSLPDLDALDHAALKALLLSQQEKYTATLTSRTSEIERLMLLVEWSAMRSSTWWR